MTKTTKGKIFIAVASIIAVIVLIAFFNFISSYIAIASFGLTIVLFLIKSDKAEANAKNIEKLENRKIDKEDEKITAIDGIIEQLEELEGIKKQLESLEELKGLNTEFNNFKELFDNTNKKLIDIQIQDRKPVLEVLHETNRCNSYGLEEAIKKFQLGQYEGRFEEYIPIEVKIKNRNSFNIDIKSVEIYQLVKMPPKGYIRNQERIHYKKWTYNNYYTLESKGVLLVNFRYLLRTYMLNAKGCPYKFVLEVSFNKDIYNYTVDILFNCSFDVKNDYMEIRIEKIS